MDTSLIDELNDKPSRKKLLYPVNPELSAYLKHQGREVKLPVSHRDLLNFTWSIPIKDKDGNYTHWEKAIYDKRDWDFLKEGLVKIYAILKTEGDMSFANQLDVARIDYCNFGNSLPFRIRIINKFNANFDHYYMKITDASRIYGLEMEHILSPNRITFYTDGGTLVEEHIPGIPGDVFLNQYLDLPETNKTRFAKEFVKFNERCFVRLLGDMRSYNFVIVSTPDIEGYQYRIRAIDFDQQSYEGRKSLYMPQFFKENNRFVQTVLSHLNKESIEQYKAEERSAMAFRVAAGRFRLMELLNIMSRDTISPVAKQKQLAEQLNQHFHTAAFNRCNSMGQILKLHLKYMLRENLKLIQEKTRSLKKPVFKPFSRNAGK
ncbi:hypothetical protein LL912_04540 [Niabella sp. CC-SYL272]|uniref:hypothetical protein n=1 Tax=Niabella agricola TaxID=2891571 RepID=UPI001F443F3C|nr:hypothetical protein [Niabella agricola]MCF3108040.1 hypothetical protein [Niabella agricola]